MRNGNPDTGFALADRREALPPPADGRLIVHVVVNVEHWPFDRAMPRAILPPPHAASSVPDVPNFSWLEYGLRCGLPRLIGLLGEFGLPASVSMNASVIDAYPAAAEAILEAGWEPIGHGVDQRSLQQAPDEAATIEATLERIQRFFGARPRGWLGPGLQETFETPTLLRRAGVDYVLDWPFDEVPVWMPTGAGPLIAMPYALELNDSVLHAVEQQPSDAMLSRLGDTLATLERELEREPRILTLALHPHLIGVPHRIGHLRKALELLGQRRDTVFMTGSSIADWFASAAPPPVAVR
jgi:peptidoglycan/xylan/chitin deacetylase (PgdA/CDA1 family)